MRYVWLVFVALITGILGFVGWRHFRAAAGPGAAATTLAVVSTSASATEAPAAAPRLATLLSTSASPRADSLVHFAMQQLGSPYTYAGTTPLGGFDCSGFLLYVYGHFGIPVPHSTALLITTGVAVPREQARRGDLVVFTGTAASATTPGHAGIVISEPGEPLRFIHSSSARRESGVKISQVEGTDYERRFMEIRRVLGVVKTVAPRTASARTATPTPALAPKAPAVVSTLVVPAPRVRKLPAPLHRRRIQAGRPTSLKAAVKPKSKPVAHRPGATARKKRPAVPKKRAAHKR